MERWDGKTNYSVKEDKDEERSRITNWEEFLGGDGSSSDEDGTDLCDQGGRSSSVSPYLVASEDVPAAEGGDRHIDMVESRSDYWETLSPERVDTDDELKAGGSSGDETA